MNILHKRRFVIETKVPKTFANKQIMTDHGPTTVPVEEQTTYEYMWFAGIGVSPAQQARILKQVATGARPEPPLPMNMWTPYPAQAAVYAERDLAEWVLNGPMGGMSGGYVIEWELSHHLEGRQIIETIDGAGNVNLNV